MTVSIPPVAARDLVFVAGGDIVEEGVTVVRECQGEQLVIGCGYRDLVLKENVNLYDVTGGSPVQLPLTDDDLIGFFEVLSHTLSARATQGTKRYKCDGGPHYDVEVNISFVESSGIYPCMGTVHVVK